jgi:histidinol phosphatase-like enzyme
MICIVDIDGTLALRNDRDPYDYESAGQDWPNNSVVRVVRLLNSAGCAIVYFTGRKDRSSQGISTRQVTQQWLDKHVAILGPLYMRSELDDRKDSILKAEMLARLLREMNCGKEEILCVIDDRKQVVDMWRSEGLLCLDVAGYSA